MKKFKKGLLQLAAISIIAIGAGATPASAKTARCVVTSQSGDSFRGPCNFMPAERGSYTIQPTQRGKNILGAVSVSVWITRPNEAEVRGLTDSGINSRWGTATRSKKEPACWVGSDFKICVY